MSLREFGLFVDISHTHISRLEKEYSNKGKEKLKVPIDELMQICEKTGYPFRQFLEEAGYLEACECSPIVSVYERLSEGDRATLLEYAESLLAK